MLLRALVLAGGLAVVATVLNGRLGAGDWEIVALDGDGIPSVDGRPVPSTHPDQLARRIRPGARVRIPRGLGLEIQSRGALALEAGPGTDFTVPRRPGRWWGRRVSCELEGGVLRIAADAGFRGGALTVITPAARVVIVSGAAAVAAESRGTRVGVLAGDVSAAPQGAARVTVGPGAEGFFYSAAINPSTATLAVSDRQALERLGRRVRR